MTAARRKRAPKDYPDVIVHGGLPRLVAETAAQELNEGRKRLRRFRASPYLATERGKYALVYSGPRVSEILMDNWRELLEEYLWDEPPEDVRVIVPRSALEAWHLVARHLGYEYSIEPGSFRHGTVSIVTSDLDAEDLEFGIRQLRDAESWMEASDLAGLFGRQKDETPARSTDRGWVESELRYLYQSNRSK